LNGPISCSHFVSPDSKVTLFWLMFNQQLLSDY
jgi:hypothetical protein